MSRNLRKVLTKVLPDNFISFVPRSFEIIGSKIKAVAIIEVPIELSFYEEEIAKAIMVIHKNVVSVLSKVSERVGDYRTRNLKIIYGTQDTVVIHKESSCFFKIDPVKAYFSPRESIERDRFSEQVRSGENILVMFGGVGPIAIRIAKHHIDVTVTTVELNPYAHKFCVENIYMNKVGDRVKPILGDVKEICPKLGKVFDRVIMPLPKDAYKFLELGISNLKRNGFLHFYHWAPNDFLYEEATRLIMEATKNRGRLTEINDLVKVSQYSPRIWKIRIDAKII